jgi:hypothetical protein
VKPILIVLIALLGTAGIAWWMKARASKRDLPTAVIVLADDSGACFVEKLPATGTPLPRPCRGIGTYLRVNLQVAAGKPVLVTAAAGVSTGKLDALKAELLQSGYVPLTATGDGTFQVGGGIVKIGVITEPDRTR